MIKVDVCKSNENIVSLIISGHANQDDKGKDLVCAGVSSIAFGVLNALEEEQCTYHYNINDNEIIIDKLGIDVKTQAVIKTALWQIRTVQAENADYIQINMEV